MQIHSGNIIRNNTTKNAYGGSELQAMALVERVPKELLEPFQIFVSRVEDELDPTKIRILWFQDLPNDPASSHLANGGWKKFHKLVFNSNWQMQAYINYFNIPWSKCVVLLNAIDPVPVHEKPEGPIHLGYWSTPHRGLEILVPVFEALAQKHDIELDVFSSFKIYGWEERDQQYRELFDRCKEHPKINYYGSVPNQKIREHLPNMHILAYPNIWPETSCITLMEAMAAGMICVHSNLACLYETGANWTTLYQFNEDMNAHANLFYSILDTTIQNYNDPSLQNRIKSQASYANIFYSWDVRKHQWAALLSSLALSNEPREIPETTEGFFQYKVL